LSRSEVFAFCDESSDTPFFIVGSAEVQQRIYEALTVTQSVHAPISGNMGGQRFARCIMEERLIDRVAECR
jgi:hypothetical protein